MALTKRQIANQVIHLKSGGSNTGERDRYNIRYIMSFIEPAINYLIQKHFFLWRNEDSYSVVDEFCTTYNDVPVKFDTVRKLYYSDLPGSLISIPDDRGLRQISYMEGEDGGASHMIRIPSGGTGAWNELEATDLMGQKGYWPEPGKVFYKNLPYELKTDGKVLIKMIVAVPDLGEDDIIPMPGSMELELIETVRRLLDEKNQPEGIVNDNNAAV